MYFVTILDKSQFFSKTLPADAGTRLSHAKTKHKKKGILPMFRRYQCTIKT